MPLIKNAVVLTSGERKRLEKIASNTNESRRTRQRAQVLLQSAKGATDSEIARELRLTLKAIEYLRKRFVDHGINAVLYPTKPRNLTGRCGHNGGRPAKVTFQHEQLILRLIKRPPPQRDRWTLAALTDQLATNASTEKISYGSVYKILKKHKIQLKPKNKCNCN